MLPRASIRFGQSFGLSKLGNQVRFKRVGPPDFAEPPVPKRKSFKESILPIEWNKLVDKYPEFLPNPLQNSPILTHRMIDDMLARRTVIEIPEFYVGTLMAVNVSDQFSDTKRSKFVGICIERQGQLKFAQFTLRNVIDGMGCEVRYDLYNPLILSIEVLKLEKRLDEDLRYLRDADPSYSTVPEDMKPIIHPDGAEVPVNKTLVKMRPWPWSRRWEKMNYMGIEALRDVPEYFANKSIEKFDDPIYNYDLMSEYRQHCTEELIYNICRRLAEHEKVVVEPRKATRARTFLKLGKDLLMRKTPQMETTSTS